MNVSKHVVEDTQTVEVPVTREEVYIQRRAVTDESAAGEVFDDGENIHIPVMEERVEVTKRPVVNEEIIVGKRKSMTQKLSVKECVVKKRTIERKNDVLNEQVEMNRFERNELNQSINNRNRL